MYNLLWGIIVKKTLTKSVNTAIIFKVLYWVKAKKL